MYPFFRDLVKFLSLNSKTLKIRESADFILLWKREEPKNLVYYLRWILWSSYGV